MAGKPGIDKLKKETKSNTTKPVKNKRASIFGGRKSGSEDFLSVDNETPSHPEEANNNSFFAEDMKKKSARTSKTKAPKTKVSANKRNNSFFTDDIVHSEKNSDANANEVEPETKTKKQLRAEKREARIEAEEAAFLAEEAAFIAEEEERIAAEQEKTEALAQDAKENEATVKPGRGEKREARKKAKQARILAEEQAFEEEERAFEEEERIAAEQERADALAQDAEDNEVTVKPSRGEKRKARQEAKRARILAEEQAFEEEERALEEEKRTAAEQERADALAQDAEDNEATVKPGREEKREAREKAKQARILAEEQAFEEEERAFEEEERIAAEQERADALAQDAEDNEVTVKPSRGEKRKARQEAKRARILAEEQAFEEEERAFEEEERIAAEQERADALAQDAKDNDAAVKPSKEDKREARRLIKEERLAAKEAGKAEEDIKQETAGVEPEDIDEQDVKKKGGLLGFLFAGRRENADGAEKTKESRGRKADKSNDYLGETETNEKPEPIVEKQENVDVPGTSTKPKKQKNIIKLGERKSEKRDSLSTRKMYDKNPLEKKPRLKVKRLEMQSSGFFAGIIAKVKRILPGRKSEAQALAYAQGEKKSGGKRKKVRRIAIYATSGALVIAILMVVIFVPFGKAADETPEAESAAIAVNEPVVTSTPTQVTMAPTVDPEDVVTLTPVITTPPDQTHRTFNIDSMVEDCMVDASLYYNEVGYSSNYYKYTENDIYMLAQLIHGEARGESLDGKVAVGNVVMNRVLNRSYFGNSMTAVITASHQFSGYNPNTVPGSASKYAARLVLDRQVWVVPQNVYYFKSSGTHGIDWGSHKFYVQIGGHSFYTHRYSGRSNTDKIPPRMFERTFKWPRMGCYPEDRVYRIQFMLNQLGYDVIADSYFGVGTKDELKKFQEAKGLDADGVAGPSTIEALIKAYGIEDYFDKFYS